MRKISAMYEESGGTSASHKCGECSNFLQEKKHNKCEIYRTNFSELPDWKESYPACKWFNTKHKKRKAYGQITLEDYMKEMDHENAI